MDINYSKYLDGDMWPSESLAATVNPATGEYEPALQPVIDMVPQKAVAALHKLIRWSRSLAIDAIGEEQEERFVRQSTLGRLLARKALRVEDFELYQEHGIDRTPLGNQQFARVIAKELMDVVENLPPREVGQLATDLSIALNNEGYMIYKEE